MFILSANLILCLLHLHIIMIYNPTIRCQPEYLGQLMSMACPLEIIHQVLTQIEFNWMIPSTWSMDTWPPVIWLKVFEWYLATHPESELCCLLSSQSVLKAQSVASWSWMNNTGCVQITEARPFPEDYHSVNQEELLPAGHWALNWDNTEDFFLDHKTW